MNVEEELKKAGAVPGASGALGHWQVETHRTRTDRTERPGIPRPKIHLIQYASTFATVKVSPISVS